MTIEITLLIILSSYLITKHWRTVVRLICLFILLTLVLGVGYFEMGLLDFEIAKHNERVGKEEILQKYRNVRQDQIVQVDGHPGAVACFELVVDTFSKQSTIYLTYNRTLKTKASWSEWNARCEIYPPDKTTQHIKNVIRDFTGIE
jgi:hypothetical protein